MLLGEVALQLQQQACQRICIALNILKHIVIKIQYLVEIAEQRLTFKHIGIGIDAYVVFLFFIILIINLAHNFLKDIFQRNQSTGTTKLINYDSDMHLILLEVTKQVVNLLGLRNEIRRTNQRLPTESC